MSMPEKTKRWKPIKTGDTYYAIAIHPVMGIYLRSYYYFNGFSKTAIKTGNYFHTKKEANAKLRLIKKILKEKQ